MAATGNQLGGADDFLGVLSIEKEGIRLDRFVREAAAAGLLPGEALVENRNLKTPAGKTLAAEGAGRPSSDDGYIVHGVCWLSGPLTEFYGANGALLPPPLQSVKSVERSLLQTRRRV